RTAVSATARRSPATASPRPPPPRSRVPGRSARPPHRARTAPRPPARILAVHAGLDTGHESVYKEENQCRAGTLPLELLTGEPSVLRDAARTRNPAGGWS